MENKTKNLSINEVLMLGIELNGSPQRGLKGLMAQDMKFKLRYKLTKIVNQVKAEAEEFQKIQNEAIKKYGEPSGETFTIPNTVKVGGEGEDKDNEILNPKVKEYMDEINSVLELKKDILVPSLLSIDEFDDVITSEDCSVLISLLD